MGALIDHGQTIPGEYVAVELMLAIPTLIAVICLYKPKLVGDTNVATTIVLLFLVDWLVLASQLLNL